MDIADCVDGKRKLTRDVFVKILLVPILVIAVINLSLAIVIYFVVKKLAAKSTHAKRWAWLSVVLWYVIPVPFVLWTLFVLPLPSDEYMTEHFYQHRQEFDAMVKAYREEHLLKDPRANWDDPEEIQQAKIKADVWNLTSMSGNRWHENPYSIEAAKDFRHLIRSGPMRTAKDHSLDGVIVLLNIGHESSLREMAQVSKWYLHIPLVPKIENDKLLLPVDAVQNEYTKQRYLGVKESLDYYPENWERGECFVKPLDAQWFIQLCKSY